MHPRAFRLVFPDPGPEGEGPGNQAALAFEPRELWIAAYVPQLPLAALRSSARAMPLVVIDPDDHNRCIVDADPEAQPHGRARAERRRRGCGPA